MQEAHNIFFLFIYLFFSLSLSLSPRPETQHSLMKKKKKRKEKALFSHAKNDRSHPTACCLPRWWFLPPQHSLACDVHNMQAQFGWQHVAYTITWRSSADSSAPWGEIPPQHRQCDRSAISPPVLCKLIRQQGKFLPNTDNVICPVISPPFLASSSDSRENSSPTSTMWSARHFTPVLGKLIRQQRTMGRFLPPTRSVRHFNPHSPRFLASSACLI